jgi:hypothetical protein
LTQPFPTKAALERLITGALLCLLRLLAAVSGQASTAAPYAEGNTADYPLSGGEAWLSDDSTSASIRPASLKEAA